MKSKRKSSPQRSRGAEKSCAVARDIWGPLPRRVQDWEEVLKEAEQAREMPFAWLIGVTVGKIKISKTSAEKLWLQHESGHGMETDEAKLAKVLEKFFEKEF